VRRQMVAGLAGMSLLLSACGRETEGPPPPDPDLVALGSQIYRQNCASCHGPTGEGQPTWERPDELGELPAPPHDSTGHTWKHSDRMLYHIVLRGWRDPFNKTDRLTMPAFQGVLIPTQIRAVLTYLKTLWNPEQRHFQWRESQDEPFPEDGA
jgi:mono/diheme cytochrome c family protein